MGIGIGLGGVARGLESAENTSIRQRALGIQEQALKRDESNALLGQADKLIASEMELATKIIDASRGQPPEKIAQAVAPLLEDIDRLATGAGRDPASFRAQIEAYLQAPAAADPADRKKQLEVDALEREAAREVARLEDVAFSATDALNALDTLEKIPGGEVFLLNPGLITPARQALAAKGGGGLLGKLQRALGVNELPSQLTGLSEEQLLTALDAAETVSKQRNALATGLSNQAGTAGLRSQLQARGEGAGLSVQRKVFGQALELANRELGKETVPESTGPLPLPGTEEAMKKGQVYNLPDGRQALWNGKALELLN